MAEPAQPPTWASVSAPAPVAVLSPSNGESGNHPPVLVISNIAWDFVWQRHQTMALLFARERDVIFCEIPGVRRVGWADLGRIARRLFSLGRRAPPVAMPPRIRLLRPLVLPATNALFCAFNGWRMRRLAARDAALQDGVGLVFNYSASRTALQLIAQLPPAPLVYDCTDDWMAVRGIPAFLADDERRLLQQADLTLVPGRVLEARKAPLARRCVRLAHGAMLERFQVPPKPAPADGRLTLLYYGHLHRQHLDFSLLEGIALARPNWRLLLVGPVKTPYDFPANVILPGQQPHEALRDFVAQADVLLLPYVLNDYTQAVLPAKTYECLATGRPVVATPLPDLRTELKGQIAFATRADEWIRAIERGVATDTPAARAGRMAVAAANSWDARFEQLRGLLGELG